MNQKVISCGSFDLDLTSKTLIMGILNVTPDSFSDGGLFLDPQKALDHAVEMVKEGADIIDIGGESTRPGSDPVSAQDEIYRVLPVIELLLKTLDIPISIDTRKSEVAAAALKAGVNMVNDVSGLRFDPEMATIVHQYHVPIVIMHAKGQPKDMQENPVYDDLIEEIIEFLNESIQIAKRKGIDDNQIIVDPGIGFGKPWKENFRIIAQLSRFSQLGYPILMGVSRKSFIGNALNLSEEKRILGTAAAVSASILNGADIVRVHDIQEMKQVCTIIDYIQASQSYGF